MSSVVFLDAAGTLTLPTSSVVRTALARFGVDLGPLDNFAGGWRFEPVEGDPERTRAVWRYSFSIKPAWLSPVANRVGVVILKHDLDRRIEGFAEGCADPVVLGAARAALET